MTDFSKLSDEDLLAYKQGRYGDISDEGLMVLSGRSVPEPTSTVAGDIPEVPESMRSEQAPQPVRQQSPLQNLKNMAQETMESRPARLAMETVTGINRQIGGLVDPFLPGTPIRDMAGEPGAFAGDDPLTKYFSRAGDYIGMSVPVATGARVMANAVKAPTLFADPTKFQKLLKVLGAGGPGDDVLYSALSGAGGAGAEDLAVAQFGEEYREVGRLIGELGAPVVAVPLQPSQVRAGLANIQTALKQHFTKSGRAGLPTEVIDDALRIQYGLLEEAGLSANGPQIDSLVSKLNKFALDEQITGVSSHPINTKINQLIKAADEGQLSYGVIMDAVSDIRKRFNGADQNLNYLGDELAALLDNELYNMPITDDLVGALGGDSPRETISRVRDLYRQRSNIAFLENATERAHDLSKGTKTDSDFLTNLEKELKKAYTSDSSGRIRGQGAYMTQEERNNIRKLVNGGVGRASLELVGKLGWNSQDFVKTLALGTAASFIEAAARTALTGSSSTPVGTVSSVFLGSQVIGRTAGAIANQVYKRDVALAQRVMRADTAVQVMNIYRARTPRNQRNYVEAASILLDRGVATAGLANSKRVQDDAFLSQVVAYTTVMRDILMEERQVLPQLR